MAPIWMAIHLLKIIIRPLAAYLNTIDQTLISQTEVRLVIPDY